MDNSSIIETLEQDEKLYRMLMIVFDDNGEVFWRVLGELASINHWDDGTFASISTDAIAEAALLETIPEAQELMCELMRRGLIYISRTQGWPPPSSGTFRVMDEEVEAIIAEAQNWLGPLIEGPNAVYYRFCSAIPGETITRNSIHAAGF